MTDVESVGGKNASLGEMISHLPTGVNVPTGFATTAHAFRSSWHFAGLRDKIKRALLDALDTDDVRALAAWRGAEIRAMVEAQPFPQDLEQAIRRLRHLVAGAPRGCRSRCDRPPRPKTCPMRLSPASRRPS
jgi:pyruvate,water dikinase